MSLSADSVADLDAMMTDHESVVYEGVSGYGILDVSTPAESSEGGFSVQTRVTTLRVRTGYFPKFSAGNLIRVENRQYTIDGPPQIEGDGKETVLMLARSSTT